MRVLPAFFLLAVSIVGAATTGFAKHPPGSRFNYLRAEQAAGQKIFDDHCAICHRLKLRQPSRLFGPNLNGVVDRPAGIVAGFPYSDALKKSGLVWTEDNLRKWIADSAGTIPNTLMPHVSISDPAEQIYLIEYLKTLKVQVSR
jgi:cytochrome c